MTEKTCQHCEAYEPQDNTCHCEPPIVSYIYNGTQHQTALVVAVWPRVNSVDWCLQFKKRGA